MSLRLGLFAISIADSLDSARDDSSEDIEEEYEDKLASSLHKMGSDIDAENPSSDNDMLHEERIRYELRFSLRSYS